MIRRRGRSHTYSYYHNSYKFSTFARGIISSCGSTFRKHLVQHIFKGIPKRRFWYHIWHRGQVCIRYWYALLLGCYLSFVLSSVCDFVFLFSIWICCMFFTIFPQSSKVCSKDIKNVAFVISNGRETSFMSLIFNYMCACLFVCHGNSMVKIRCFLGHLYWPWVLCLTFDMVFLNVFCVL